MDQGRAGRAIGLCALVAFAIACMVLVGALKHHFAAGGRFVPVGDWFRAWDKPTLQWLGLAWFVLAPLLVLAGAAAAARAFPRSTGCVMAGLVAMLAVTSVAGVIVGLLILLSGAASTGGSPPATLWGTGLRWGTSSAMKASVGWMISPASAWLVVQFWRGRRGLGSSGRRA